MSGPTRPKSEPRSYCTCGHTGDGADSRHADLIAPGHGPCKARGCHCVRFTWKRWIGRRRKP